MGYMRISAKTDYAIRAVVEMASASEDGQLVKAEAVADAQQIPLRFLLSILNELRHAGIVDSRRGAEGGYRLPEPAEPNQHPHPVTAPARPPPPPPRRDVWVSLRSSIGAVLEHVTVADVVSGKLPAEVLDLTRDTDAWTPH